MTSKLKLNAVPTGGATGTRGTATAVPHFGSGTAKWLFVVPFFEYIR